MAKTKSAAAKTKVTSAEQAPAEFDIATGALREIVVFIRGGGTATAVLDFAGALAKEHGARLIGAFVQPEPPLTTAETFARGKGIKEVSDTQQSRLEEAEAGYRTEFENVVRQNGLRSEWRSLAHFSSDVAVSAYYADLVVIARPESETPQAGPSGLAESLVLSSGRPILLFPHDSKVSQIRRVVVAWNTTREAVRAAADALPLLARAEAVEVLVIDHERHKASHGQEPGADIARHLARHGAKVEVRRLSSDGKNVGQLMLSQATAFKADLLVMGAYGHSQLREWVFGGVTRTVLYQASIPVLMSR
jgi:nucleotide-binding universal stress UspA family protein